MEPAGLLFQFFYHGISFGAVSILFSPVILAKDSYQILKEIFAGLPVFFLGYRDQHSTSHPQKVRSYRRIFRRKDPKPS